MAKKTKTADLIRSFEHCELSWLDELSKGILSYYPNYWQQFKEHIGITKASEILKQRAEDMQLRRDNPNRWRFEKLAKRYYMSLYKDRAPSLPTSTDRVKLTVVQSFFSHSRMALEFRRGEIKEPVSVRRYYDYSLADLESAKKFGDIKTRWIVLGGKSLGQRIGVFRKLKRAQIAHLLTEQPPVPIDIVTTKRSGVISHPCLDSDALEAARDLIAYLDQIDPQKENPYILPGYKNLPMTEHAIGDAIKRVANIAHAANTRVFRYKERSETLRFHNFRKFLNAALQNAHVDPDLRDWIIGHKLSSTKKAYTTTERIQAYRDAEKYLLLPRYKGIEDRVRVIEETMSMLPTEQVAKLKEMGIRLQKKKDLRDLSKAKIKTRRVVSEEDLENDLNHGWRYIATLPSGKILIEREE